MSTNKTERFGLHAWEPEDRFLREEFNENFARLDGAARVVAGAYTGDGEKTRVIDLGITPLAVLVMTRDGLIRSNVGELYGGLAFWGNPASKYGGSGTANKPVVELVAGGFQVKSRLWDSQTCTNENPCVYHYLAIC